MCFFGKTRVGNASVEIECPGQVLPSLGLRLGGGPFKSEGFVQLVALLVLVTLTVSHWLVEPLVQLFQPLFLLSWLPWAFLGAGLWLLAGDNPPNSGR